MSQLKLITVFIFLSTFSFAQIEKKLNQVLVKKDYSALLKIVHEYSVEKDRIKISAGNSRELVEGFQESLFYITRRYSFNGVISYTCNPRLNIIRRGNRIIYFYLESKEIKNYPKQFDITSDTTYTFEDHAATTEMRKRFRYTFKAPLAEKELFIDTISYGQSCGHNGEPPAEQLQVIDWVNKKDTVGLLKWLQSTNAEKQVYAVQGFYALYVRGMSLSEDTKKIIQYVRRKKGTIYTCARCDGGMDEISGVMERFKF